MRECAYVISENKTDGRRKDPAEIPTGGMARKRGQIGSACSCREHMGSVALTGCYKGLCTLCCQQVQIQGPRRIVGGRRDVDKDMILDALGILERQV